MALNPRTVNIGIQVPLTGADVDTWGANDVNPNMVSLDGFLAGVQTIAITNVPVTLTSPASYTPTPGAGPTQAENRVLRFTGSMSGNVRITLPLPGLYTIENLALPTGLFALSFQGVTATEVVAVGYGERQDIYNDGANVRFVNMGRIAHYEDWAISSLPPWVTACTVQPYLICDGTVYNVSQYPVLAAYLGSTFGGNGVTTFGVPDTRGRVNVALDPTGTRITVPLSGINGNVIGSAGGIEAQTLTAAQVPSITSSVSTSGTLNGSTSSVTLSGNGSTTGGGSFPVVGTLNNGAAAVSVSGSMSGSATSNNTGGQAHLNVQPTIISGIRVIKT